MNEVKLKFVDGSLVAVVERYASCPICGYGMNVEIVDDYEGATCCVCTECEVRFDVIEAHPDYQYDDDKNPLFTYVMVDTLAEGLE